MFESNDIKNFIEKSVILSEKGKKLFIKNYTNLPLHQQKKLYTILEDEQIRKHTRITNTLNKIHGFLKNAQVSGEKKEREQSISDIQESINNIW